MRDAQIEDNIQYIRDRMDIIDKKLSIIERLIDEFNKYNKSKTNENLDVIPLKDPLDRGVEIWRNSCNVVSDGEVSNFNEYVGNVKEEGEPGAFVSFDENK